MKKFLIFVVLLPVLLFPTNALADSPIYTGLLWDTAPAAAYNSKDGEFLAVWNMYNVLYPPTDKRFFGPLMGQLMKESGEKIGQPFEISTAGGVLPDVAYNAAKNEYLVVTEQAFNTVGQRVSALGMTIGGPTILLTNARYPRVLYNSLAGNYLVTGAWLTDTGSGNCTIQLYSRQVNGYGQPLGSSHLVANKFYGPCEDVAVYAIAYAPIVTAKTPQGRYLLAIKDPEDLTMLDSEGEVLLTLYNPNEGTWEPGVPFQSTKVGQPYGIDVAYGQSHDEPVFFLVWGDIGLSVPDYGQWTGIWGGIVDAEKEVYYTTHAVTNDTAPISYQYSHYSSVVYAKEWRPVVAYNPTADTFVVAWRETPDGDPRDFTGVNHIRANTSEGYRIPPHPNLVISSTGGTENPTLPCIASSSKTSSCLIAWEDHRNFFGVGDIYGSFFNAGTRTPSNILPPGPDSGKSYWKAVSGGGIHTLGLYNAGGPSGCDLLTWGGNSFGQLGLGVGDTTDRHIPTKVGSYSDWTSIAAGSSHSLGIRSDGSLWAWGVNIHGQLGLGDTTDRHIPTKVGSYSDWTSIAAGDHHSFGIRSDGSLWAWGWNSFGQLGLGDTTNQHIPTKVGSYSDWTSIAAGHHSLGIRSDGSLWAWGYAVFGQLGLGDTTSRHIPTKVGSYSDWTSIAAGFYHSLGIRSDGSLWAWGLNGDGQLGLGDTTNRHTPVKVGSASDWTSIEAGIFHSLGIRSDGSLWAWGENVYGQLGLGDATNRHIPRPVPPLPPCPQCTGDPVVLTNETFPAGTVCECTAATSITIGTGTTVKNGAFVDFNSPKVTVKSGAKFETGAVVRIKQQ